jgi:hypothetical protein
MKYLEWMRGLCLPFRGCNGFPSTVWLDPSTYIEGLCLCFRSVERFDPREGLWTQIPAMGSKRGSLSATVLNGKLYALGGFDGTNFLNTVEIFDPRGHAWMPVGFYVPILLAE